VWAKRLASDEEAAVRAVAVDANGNIGLAGDYSGSVDFGGGPTSLGAYPMESFVAGLDPSGGVTFTSFIGGWQEQFANDARFDDSGTRLYVTGQTCGPTQFDTLDVDVASRCDAFLAAYDSAGEAIWAQAFGDPTGSNYNWINIGSSIAPRSGGGVVMTGTFRGDVDFGSGAIHGDDLVNVFVAAYDDAGTATWSEAYGPGWGRAADVDAFGRWIVAGDFSESVDFGQGALVNQGSGKDLFVAALMP
jgi:hypothetical protein